MKRPFILLLALTLLSGCTSRAPQTIELPGEMTVEDEISNLKVNAFAQDSKGYVWMGTFRGLNRYNSRTFRQYFSVSDESGLQDNQVNGLFCDSKGRMWVATVNGIARHNDDDSFTRIACETKNRDFFYLFENSKGSIFAANSSDLFLYDEQTESLVSIIAAPEFTFRKFFIGKNDEIWSIWNWIVQRYDSDYNIAGTYTLPRVASFSYVDKEGYIWFSDGNGVGRFSTLSCETEEVPAAIDNCRELSTSTIRSMLSYETGHMLFMTDNGAFLYYPRDAKVIRGDDPSFPFRIPPFTNVTTIFRDSNHNLWFGSEDRGWFLSNRYTDIFDSQSLPVTTLRGKTVESIAYHNGSNTLLFATNNDGLYAYSRSDERMEHYPSFTEKRLLVDGNDVLWTINREGNYLTRWDYSSGKAPVGRSKYNTFYPLSLEADAQGNLYMGAPFGVLQILKKGSESIESVGVLKDTIFTFMPGILPLRDGSVLCSSFGHLPVLYRQDGTSEPIDVSQEDVRACIKRSAYIPTQGHEGRDGTIWLGTVANGLIKYDRMEGRMEPVPGVPCIDISGVVEDGEGNIWVSTMHGIGMLDINTGNFTNYYAEDGTGGNQFVDRSSCTLPDGTIVFGGNHGITMFNPAQKSTIRTVPAVIEDLKVHNKLAIRGIPSSGLILDHTQNAFSISFSALNYSQREQMRYYYMMEGHDPDWIDAGPAQEAYYSNLPAGEYIFKVRASNRSGSVVSDEVSIPVRIKVAPWLSWWAKIIYFLVASSIIAFILYRRRKNNLVRAEAERATRDRIFFTNVAHEFRSPLTMITGPVSMLMGSDHLDVKDRELVGVIERSSTWMQHLIGQILDLSKMENNALELHTTPLDITAELAAMMDVFTVSAEVKGITLTAEGLDEPFTMPVDRDKLTKIISNLMTNALKFTPPGGNIRVRFDSDDSGYATIEVVDTGVGIEPEQREKIFEKYYQTARGASANGTGIGLHYARELARIHHGDIKALANPSGQGSLLVVTIPYMEERYSEEELNHDSGERSAAFVHGAAPSRSLVKQFVSEKPKLLAVDDDMDVANYLHILLSDEYDVTCCFDGETALKIMASSAPDLVLSDVMMPGMDGCELCAKIKENMQLSHIPVILVTAKASVDDQIEGLDAGADAYVAKPFEPKYLLAVIRSLLEKRKSLQTSLNASADTAVIEKEDVLSPQDKAFLKALYQIMESELANSDLDINHIADMMKISRTKFFYKVKALTGESPGVFFKNYKFNRAVELIREGQLNLSEIAYRTGFASLSQFSTSFKKRFGVPPSEFR